ncbi:kinase-like domain-containing protein [Rhizoctonia solani]|nr:kinase-like domain-containing protein [Rhizoctonia solani]
MVSNKGRALIADYGNDILKGLSLLFAPTTSYSMTHQYGPPEHLISENTPAATKQSDVYSYGMTALEILSGEMPFAGKNVTWLIRQALAGELLPSRPRMVENDIWRIILACWAHDPSGRPSISTIRFPMHDPDGFEAFSDLLSPLMHLSNNRFPSMFGQKQSDENRTPRVTPGLDSGQTPPSHEALEIDAKELCKIWTKYLTSGFTVTSFEWFRDPAGTQSEFEYLLFKLKSEETLGHPAKY